MKVARLSTFLANPNVWSWHETDQLDWSERCPLLGGDRKRPTWGQTDAIDPKRTSDD
jgi:hypothetical protein